MVQRLKGRNEQLEAKITLYEENGICLVGSAAAAAAAAEADGVAQTIGATTAAPDDEGEGQQQT